MRYLLVSMSLCFVIYFRNRAYSCHSFLSSFYKTNLALSPELSHIVQFISVHFSSLTQIQHLLEWQFQLLVKAGVGAVPSTGAYNATLKHHLHVRMNESLGETETKTNFLSHSSQQKMTMWTNMQQHHYPIILQRKDKVVRFSGEGTGFGSWEAVGLNPILDKKLLLPLLESVGMTARDTTCAIQAQVWHALLCSWLIRN